MAFALSPEVLALDAAEIRRRFAHLWPHMIEAVEEVSALYLRAIKENLNKSRRQDIAREWFASKPEPRADGRIGWTLFSTHPFSKLREFGSAYLEGGVVRAGKNPPKCGKNAGRGVTQFLTVPLPPAKTEAGRSRGACSFKFLRPMFRKGAEAGVLAEDLGAGKILPYFALVKQVRIPAHPYAAPAIEATRELAAETFRFYALRALQGRAR